MTKDISIIKQEIYDFAQNYDIYKNNSFSEACFKLTCAVEESFINLLMKGLYALQPKDISHNQDKFRGAYREALKNAYRFCNKPESNVEPQIWLEELDLICANLTEYFGFNDIRNLFEQTQLGRYTVEINSENQITFIRNKSNRSKDSELYARWINNNKPEEEKRKESSEDEKQLYLFMIAPQFCKFWDVNEPTLSNSSHFKKVYKAALGKVKNDNEEQINYNFGEFNTDEFQKVYAVLVAMSVTILNYHLVSRLFNKIEKDKYKPIARINQDELIALIQQYSGLSILKIKAVINYIIYNPQFHADKITIYQPLFLFGDTIFFSPSIVYYSMAYDKILYLAKRLPEFQAVISQVAKEREEIMTDDLCEFLETNSQLLYTTNFIVMEGTKSIAEFDLIIYDEVNRKLLLTELKWFFKGDGEFDHAKIDRKLQETVSDRIKKERIAKEHLKEIQKELNIQEDSDIEIQSCIVSKNFSGSDFIEDDLAIFDEFLFKQILANAKFDLSKLFDELANKSYIPDMGSFGYSYVPCTVKLAGYQINFEGIAKKNI